MTWPLPEDYQQALQSPRNSLLRSLLKEVAPRLDPLMRPRVQTGASAAVFEVTDPQDTSWALRCFTRTVPESAKRYRLIGETLRRAGLPYFVDFEYVEEGIRIGDKPYPLIQMEWLESVPFAVHVERHVSDSAELRRMARQVHTLVLELEAQGLAHGDLSGDNLRVADGRLRLIDYDGLYSQHLQELSPPGEAGTEHFRHPLRPSQPCFGPGMDRFPALVCITSLHAMSVTPSLWAQFGATDRLLFQESDLLAPETSPVFQALLQHPDREVRRLTQTLAEWCKRPPSDIPALPAPPASGVLRAGVRKGLGRAAGGLLGLGGLAGLLVMLGPWSAQVGSATSQPAGGNETSTATGVEPPGPAIPTLEDRRLEVEQAVNQAEDALARGDLSSYWAVRLQIQFAKTRYQNAGGSPADFEAVLPELDRKLRRARMDVLKAQTQAALAEAKKAERQGDYAAAVKGLFVQSSILQMERELPPEEVQPLLKQVHSEMERLGSACEIEIEEGMAVICPD